MVIGTCSICSGPVDDTYSLSGGPKCRSCGATKRMPYGPVIDMEPCKTPAHPHPMDQLRPFPFPTLPPKDSIKRAIESEQSRKAFMFVDGQETPLTDSQEAFRNAIDKALPGLKGSISVRRINLGD